MPDRIEAVTRQYVNPALRAHVEWWKSQGSPSADSLTPDQSQHIDHQLAERLKKVKSSVSSLSQFPFRESGVVSEQIEFVRRRRKMDQLVGDVLLAVGTSTAVLVPYRDLGIERTLIDGLRINDSDGVPIYWGQQDLLSYGKYSFKEKSIRIRRELPDPDEVLGSLARYGYLNGNLEIIGHELLHATLHSVSLPSHERNVGFRTMMEAQAYRTIGGSRYRTPEFVASTIENAKRVDGTRDYGYASREKIDEAIWIFDRLNALGFSLNQASFLIGNVNWEDEEKGGFGFLIDVINKKAQELGLTSKNLDVLVRIKHQENQVDRLTAGALAQSEIKSAA